MTNRSFSILLALALVAGVFSALPAGAQETPPVTVPTVVNIEDPAGDANYVNDQGVGLPIPGDQTQASAGTVSDILKVWFTSDAQNINVHIVTAAVPPASTPLIFHVRVDPGTGSNCLWFRATFPSRVQGQDDPVVPMGASLRDTCATALGIQEGELEVGTTADGEGVTTIKIPRSLYPTFTDGSVLKTPTADTRNFPAGQITAPQIDNTLPGTDYTITSGSGPVIAPAPSEPPGKSDPPGKGKKKGCPKGKGKKKGACPGRKKPKPPKPPTCPTFVPGEEGKDAPVAVVTDAATEEKPLELEFEAPAGGGNDLGAGAYDETASLYQNIQVDTQTPDTGLYVRYEFPDRHDYDLYLNYADGSTAANSGDANIAPGEGLGGGAPDGGWEAGTNYESVMGIRTADCAGYTARLVSFLTTGGATKLTVWLGEVKADPVAPGGGESAFDTFYTLLGLDDSSDSAQASGTPAARKGCKKGKGKKKGCKKPPVLSCATYTPGELGTDKPLVTVTDAATEAAPVEQTVTLAESVADLDQTGMVSAASADYFNVQVDTSNADTGLYALFEFPARRDYDLGLLYADGSYGARSRRWNTISESTDQGPFPISTTGHGGAGTDATEFLDGIKTADCGGWTVETENWLGEGGEFTVKLWLGEAKLDPQAPGVEPR